MKPILIYDGDCKFCTRWIQRWKTMTGDSVDYAPYQQVAAQYPKIKPESFEKAVQLIDENGKVFNGAEAVFKTLAYSPGNRWMFWVYQKIPGAKLITEAFYAFVAKNRVLFSGITHFLWGNNLDEPTFYFSRMMFMKFLAIIYVLAFASIGLQVVGLFGEQGITPIKNYLFEAAPMLGVSKYWFLPTIFWVNSSDLALQLVCWVGAGLAVILFFGFFQAPILFILWFLYLSLVTVGRYFLWYQWDILLLEAGFISIFLAPIGGVRPKDETSPPSKLILFLFFWLIFRLMFSSGMVKLTSGDLVWRNLTALDYHYLTQPIPNWISYYMYQLPESIHKLSTAIMFLIELAMPFLIFTPRRTRHFGAAMLISLQIFIIVTGNYAAFNWLSIALCILLFDDYFWNERVHLRIKDLPCPNDSSQCKRWPKRLIRLVAVVLILLSTKYLFMVLPGKPKTLPFIRYVDTLLTPFNLVNSYGLFAVMTKKRYEVEIQGSNDGKNWKVYEFKYKPGDLKTAPKFVAPHQPRLDWQMWFAALGPYQEQPWFTNFMVRLLQNSKPVLGLIKTNPFQDHPPKFVRAVMYDYQFTDLKTKKETGQWWQRKLMGQYFPPISLKKG